MYLKRISRRKLCHLRSLSCIFICLILVITVVSLVCYLNKDEKLLYSFGLKRYKLPVFVQSNKHEHVELPNDCDFNNVRNDQYYVNIDGQQYPKYIPLYQSKQINFTCLNKINKRNRIILWNKFTGTNDYNYGIGNRKPFIDNRCPVTNCEITDDKRLVNESDFVVIHIMESLDELPKWKFDYQRYVFYEYESPLHTIDLKMFNNVFNMSSTYRLDSNTTSLYFVESSFNWTLNHKFDENQDYFSQKDRFSAIIVSNCNDKINRMGFVRELQKYIPVTVYGRCGRECPYNCHNLIGNKYKFYFAFENSFCKDYITEKFFGMLKYNIIPVVLGGGQYDLFIPKSGYISTLDYETPKDLAEYLLYLSTNKTAYNSYFKWKKHVIFDSYNPYLGHICELCILLNMDAYKGRIERHFIQDMNKFWHPSVDCKKPDFDHNTFKFKKYSYYESVLWQKRVI